MSTARTQSMIEQDLIQAMNTEFKIQSESGTCKALLTSQEQSKKLKIELASTFQTPKQGIAYVNAFVSKHKPKQRLVLSTLRAKRLTTYPNQNLF